MNKKCPRTRHGGLRLDLIENIKNSLKGNIDKKCYMCLLDNREVENMVRDKSRQWGDLTTRVIYDNTECPDCIV